MRNALAVARKTDWKRWPAAWSASVSWCSSCAPSRGSTRASARSPACEDSVDSVLTILGHRLRHRIGGRATLRRARTTLDCYPSLLNQALMNLVANAIDAIDAGRVRRRHRHPGRRRAASQYVLNDSATTAPVFRKSCASACSIPSSPPKQTWARAPASAFVHHVLRSSKSTAATWSATPRRRGTVAELSLPLCGPPSRLVLVDAVRRASTWPHARDRAMHRT